MSQFLHLYSLKIKRLTQILAYTKYCYYFLSSSHLVLTSNLNFRYNFPRFSEWVGDLPKVLRKSCSCLCLHSPSALILYPLRVFPGGPRGQTPVRRQKLRRQGLGAAAACAGRAGPGGAGRGRGGKLSKLGETPARPPRPRLRPLSPPPPRPEPPSARPSFPSRA